MDFSVDKLPKTYTYTTGVASTIKLGFEGNTAYEVQQYRQGLYIGKGKLAGGNSNCFVYANATLMFKVYIFDTSREINIFSAAKVSDTNLTQ